MKMPLCCRFEDNSTHYLVVIPLIIKCAEGLIWTSEL